LQNFHKVTLMNPTNPMPWFNAARTYQQLGMKVAAMMHMDIAIELDPLPAMAHRE
jgi:hypothetical protein